MFPTLIIVYLNLSERDASFKCKEIERTFSFEKYIQQHIRPWSLSIGKMRLLKGE